MRPHTAIATALLAAACTTAAADQCWNCLGVRQVGVGHVRFPCPVCEGTGTTGPLEAPGATAPGSAQTAGLPPTAAPVFAAAAPDPTGVEPRPSRPAVGRPRPVVARVTAGTGPSIDMGSGVLVRVTGTTAIVLTNWHVVRDKRHAVKVSWPDGSQSDARLVAWDQDWDLAAVAVPRPAAAPVQLASQAPRIGDRLTIAGFGMEGRYLEQTGTVTEYLSPSPAHPKQFVECQAAARHGDSGGPMFNAAGELAGLLFGERNGLTCGSCSTRIRAFLAGVRVPVHSGEAGQTTCQDVRCAIR